MKRYFIFPDGEVRIYDFPKTSKLTFRDVYGKEYTDKDIEVTETEYFKYLNSVIEIKLTIPDKEQQLKVMEKIIEKAGRFPVLGTKNLYQGLSPEIVRSIAKALINAGYGNIEISRYEFIKKLKEKEQSVKIGNEWKAVVTDEDIDELVKEIR